MNKTPIEWCDYTWNPVTGCKHGCSYCYARKISVRFTGNFEPKFHEERFYQPMKKEKSVRIFVCSMADLFGEWVPKDWIDRILNIAEACKQHEFYFLTKNPKRYIQLRFPKNCLLGTTITGNDEERMVWHNELALRGERTFISFEPLLEKFDRNIMAKTEKVFIGGLTGAKPQPANKEGMENILKQCKEKGIEYLIKNNARG